MLYANRAAAGSWISLRTWKPAASAASLHTANIVVVFIKKGSSQLNSTVVVKCPLAYLKARFWACANSKGTVMTASLTSEPRADWAVSVKNKKEWLNSLLFLFEPCVCVFATKYLSFYEGWVLRHHVEPHKLGDPLLWSHNEACLVCWPAEQRNHCFTWTDSLCGLQTCFIKVKQRDKTSQHAFGWRFKDTIWTALNKGMLIKGRTSLF